MCVFRRCHPGARSAIGSIAILVGVLCFTACGDDDSSSAPRPDDDSSVESSSSSVTPKSNDSETSVSSSSFATSSSSAALATPCKTETEDNCEYGELVDDRDGHTYKTVKIGDQWWMAENLNYAYLQPTKTLDSSSFCYNNSASYCEKYGRLYTWAAAMDSVGEWSTNGKVCGSGKTCSPTYPVRGVCPEGWHLPSKAEWATLFNAVGGQTTAGMVLKSTSGWNSRGNGTDAFGFSALPAGIRNYNGNYDDEGLYAFFWSSTEGKYAYYVILYYSRDLAYLYDNFRGNGVSVRCLKD